MSSSEAKSGGKVRGLLVNSAVALGSVLVLLVLCEVLLSLVVPVLYRPRVTRVDPILGWTHNPSSVTGDMEGNPIRVTYNRHGFRIPDHEYDNPSDRPRVVVLGDSFIDGSEVDDADLHTVHLQRAIPDAEIINLGVYGYSTAQELLLLKEEGLRYEPDLVVLVTITNDYIDNTRNLSYFGSAPRYRVDSDTLVYEPVGGPTAMATFRVTNLPAPFVSTLHRHSMVYYFLNQLIYRRIVSDRITDQLQTQMDTVSVADRLDLYRRLVLRIEDATRGAGADLLVVFAYMRQEVEGAGPSPNAAISSQLAQAGVDVVDLFEEMREAERAGPSSLWYQNDIHWNAHGHRIVAELLRPEIEERLARRADMAR